MGLLVLDTSVLVGDWPPERPAAVSMVSVGELHAGVELATTPAERARREQRLERVLETYVAMPVDLDVARAYGAVLSLSRRTDGPRNRADLLIAATAVAHAAGLATRDRRLAAFARRLGLDVAEPPAPV